jgi:hypothetical protein
MTVNRLTLPSEFFDITSAQLLAQPEPQYVHAILFKMAMGAELGVPDMLGVPGRAVGGNGADYNANGDRLKLAENLSSELFAVKVDFNGQPGHTIRFNRPKFTDSTYTIAARQIKSGQTITTTPMAVEGEQNSITLIRLGGPYDGSQVAPYAIEAFDAEMGVHKLSKVVGAHLQRDHDKTLDGIFVTLADSTSNIVYPAGMTADNDATSKGMFPLTYEQISRVAKQMDEANLPTFGDGKRCLIVSPTGKKQLKDDPQFARYAEFHENVNPLFPGFFASTPEFHVFLSTTLTRTANSSSVAVHRAQAIAPGALMGAMGRRPSVRYASDDNYGETAKVIWLGDYGMGLADTRFVYSVRYAEDVS